jgi:hypothetical protein
MKSTNEYFSAYCSTMLSRPNENKTLSSETCGFRSVEQTKTQKLTADGVNSRSRRVLEKSDGENCFLGVGLGSRLGKNEKKKKKSAPRELLRERDRVNVHRQSLTSDEFRHFPKGCYDLNRPPRFQHNKMKLL